MLYIFLSIYPFMVCLFWTTVFMLEWREANPAKRVLALFMSTCTALYLCHALFFNGQSTTISNAIYDFCNIAVFPLYLLYIYRLTDSKPLQWRQCLLLLPAVLVGISGYFTYLYTPTVTCARILIIKGIFILQILTTCWVGIRKLGRFDQQIENFFSNTEHRSVKHTRQMITVIFTCACCSAVASIVGREYFLINPWFLLIPSLIFGSLLFVVGFVGHKQDFCADDIPVDDGNCDVDTSDTPQGSTVPKTLALLSDLMETERLYLQPDLRLSDVASRLNICRTTLSSLINRDAGISFSDYVNGYRVRHAQDIMRSESLAATLSIIQIAEQSGFTSESSFYRAFRKATGMTPRKWMTLPDAEL